MLSEAQIESLLSQLTLEERVKLLVGIGMPGFFGNPKSRVPGAAGQTHSVERIGVPAVVLADGPAGVRIDQRREGDPRDYYVTSFPAPISLAATWNPELVERVGRAIGEEAREYGVDILLAPALNMHRNPLCGRIFEYFSEDPLLSGIIGAAYVRGVQSAGVGATLKHFVANEQETNRLTIDTLVSERALREIYLKPFEIVVKEARPWAIMGAYNKLNGRYCTQNEWLLTKVLRGEWGFDGLVMTDWYAGEDPVEMIKAGTDLIMPGKAHQVAPLLQALTPGAQLPPRRDEVEELLSAVREGRLSEDAINAAARRVLRVLSRTPAFRGYRYSNQPDLEHHAKIAYEAAAEGVVLLKNEGALPLSGEARVAVFGTGQVETVRGGTGSAWTYPRYSISILEGLRERGLKIDEELASTYEDYVKRMRGREEYKVQFAILKPVIPRLPEDFLSEEEVRRFAERNDAAVVVISRLSGEGEDRRPAEGDFYLARDERALLERVCGAFRPLGRKVVAVLNVCGPIEVASWRDLVDAVLLVWLPGQEAGRVVADALVGRINPSGKLPVTFPRDYGEVPSWSFPGEPSENPRRVTYEEDIYVGYRYYDTFGVEPAYEFGYGLSYTTFDYRNLAVAREGDALKVSLDVVNTGKYPGKEVVQVYVRAPKGRLDKPLQELRAFKKTRLLNPGESERVEVSIDVRSLASFDGREWVVESGVYEVRVGASSRDIRLSGTFSVESEVRFKP